MARRSYILLGALTALFLIAQLILVLFAADAPRPAFYYLVGAAIVQLSAFIAVLLHDAVLVTRHQRMDLPRPVERDLTYTGHEENVRPEALDESGKPLRRRASDKDLAGTSDRVREYLRQEQDQADAIELSEIGEQV